MHLLVKGLFWSAAIARNQKPRGDGSIINIDKGKKLEEKRRISLALTYINIYAYSTLYPSCYKNTSFPP